MNPSPNAIIVYAFTAQQEIFSVAVARAVKEFFGEDEETRQRFVAGLQAHLETVNNEANIDKVTEVLNKVMEDIWTTEEMEAKFDILDTALQNVLDRHCPDLKDVITKELDIEAGRIHTAQAEAEQAKLVDAALAATASNPNLGGLAAILAAGGAFSGGAGGDDLVVTPGTEEEFYEFPSEDTLTTFDDSDLQVLASATTEVTDDAEVFDLLDAS